MVGFSKDSGSSSSDPEGVFGGIWLIEGGRDSFHQGHSITVEKSF